MFPSVQSVRLWVRTGRTAVLERAPGTDGYLGVHPANSPGRTGGDCRCLRWRNFPGNSGRRAGPTGNWRGQQKAGKDCRRRTRTAEDGGRLMTGEDCRSDSGVTDTSRTAGPRVTLLADSLSQCTDALALRLETDARDARDCSPGGAYRADGTLGNTGNGGVDFRQSFLIIPEPPSSLSPFAPPLSSASCFAQSSGAP